jgi:hypothetical protein
MDNQSTSPQLIFPNVPSDFCPTGDWSEVLQQFIDTTLANGTINVPGLGDVTPAEITEINNQLSSQQLQIDSLDTRVDALDTRVDALELKPVVKVRYGTIAGVPAADSVQTVSFADLPDANYGVSITPICGATIGTSATPLFSLNSGSKTQNGFSIRVENNIAQITSIDWMVVHTS